MTGPATTLIGYDCSANPKKAGLARGVWDGGALRIDEVLAGTADAAAALGDWLADRPPGAPAVLAVDAPLGWPAALGPALAGHAAGDGLPHTRNRLFRRAIDDFVHATVGKRPLDVGADRIARTAAFALARVAAVRDRADLPLLTEPGPPAGAGLIEVYPAATLKARGWAAAGYKAKGPAGEAARIAVRDRLAAEAELPADSAPLTASDDALDAALCVLAAADFLAGRVHRPPPGLPAGTVRTEGWIWFGPPA